MDVTSTRESKRSSILDASQFPVVLSINDAFDIHIYHQSINQLIVYLQNDNGYNYCKQYALHYNVPCNISNRLCCTVFTKI